VKSMSSRSIRTMSRIESRASMLVLNNGRHRPRWRTARSTHGESHDDAE
jgi:hypothetical protein